ncbi:Deoxyuridine 5'-triphosphate nucleotidohydrolase, mitochondrial [Orchesella cincta]|uniref:Deoxyuridine 5'-triphosphate nucleotidohydrolase n=1 Tax=Orchesella cincta TaxID=48709 RepID=A0A1D2N7X9_ORCCI|nr:Deoxyuridine 5'-triphosphate nucleotidohydrolase, mitochondrial [Orchesella cincta]
MWIRKLTKELPSALALMICPCGKRLPTASTVCIRAKEGLQSSATKGCGGGKRNQQQRYAGCSCCRQYTSALSFQDYPLTKYIVYRTHPAFKTDFSPLSAFRKFRRTQLQLPVPRFLSSAQDHSVRSQVTEKISTNKSQDDKETFGDMPSTAELKQEETFESSPSKRKLESSSTSPQKSPEKKILKQEDQENQETKMPSSVPSSPVIDSVAVNKGSPLKNVNVQKILSFQETATPTLQFAKLSDKAHAPTKGSKFAAGYDLKSAYPYTVPKRGSCLVKTDIQIKLPEGTYGRVAPRSGLALKNKIDVGAGVIDQDYRGNVGVILFNYSDEDFVIAEGDRVAQLICEKIEYPEIEEVKSLDETERGEGGFGSTGVKAE